jgi:hypothetical protein
MQLRVVTVVRARVGVLAGVGAGGRVVAVVGGGDLCVVALVGGGVFW